MNVLSLFDGMSCGRIALERAGIEVDAYFASEVDKHAIAVTTANWPQTIQLGDVRNVNPDVLGSIDLLIGGSPCQDFSFSGNMRGMATKCKEKITTLDRYLELKEGGFEFTGQSYLFWEYVRAWHQIKARNPAAKFLLENVKMSKDNLAVLNKAMGCEPILINSALLTAQNRRRYYWTNWPTTQPEDKGIVLADILEREVSEEYLISASYLNRLQTSTDLKKRFSAVDPEKAITMTARQYANWKGNLVTALTERRTEEAKAIRSANMKRGRDFSPRRGKELAERSDGKMNCLTACYSMKEHSLFDGFEQYRKLTPIECERLQTVPDNYTAAASNTQRYKMLGNGWTVDVIAHLFRSIDNGQTSD